MTIAPIFMFAPFLCSRRFRANDLRLYWQVWMAFGQADAIDQTKSRAIQPEGTWYSGPTVD